ncbi:MAG: hypothetical protein Q4B88_04075 [Moraxella sp.]|nr:hypothetical protein [Moraxella sp.]
MANEQSVSAFDKVFSAYWRDYQNGTPIGGGMAYESRIRALTLDDSLDSLKQLDRLLIAVKKDVVAQGGEAVLLRQSTFRNFLLFLAAYAGRVVVHYLPAHAKSATWLPAEALLDYAQDVSAGKFYTVTALKPALAIAVPFYALVVVGAKLFGGINRRFNYPMTGELAPESLYVAVRAYLTGLAQSTKAQADQAKPTQAKLAPTTPAPTTNVAPAPVSHAMSEVTHAFAQKTEAVHAKPVRAGGGAAVRPSSAGGQLAQVQALKQASSQASTHALSQTLAQGVTQSEDQAIKPALPAAKNPTSLAAEHSTAQHPSQQAVIPADGQASVRRIRVPLQNTNDQTIITPQGGAKLSDMENAKGVTHEQAVKAVHQTPASAPASTPVSMPASASAPKKTTPAPSISRKSQKKIDYFAELKSDMVTLPPANDPHAAHYQKAMAVINQAVAVLSKNPEQSLEDKQLTIIAQALGLLEKVANAGNTSAMLSLALVQFEGILSKENPTTAVAWIQKAADMGDVRAQKLMSRLYYQGRGVSASVEMGEMWLARAAEGGHPEAKKLQAQFNQIKLMRDDVRVEAQKDKRYLMLLGVALLILVFVVWLGSKFLT